MPSCTDNESSLRCNFEGAEHSAARVWNEVALDGIRRDFPAPTVHARNLYHLSAAMWDVWSAWGTGTALFAEPSDGVIKALEDGLTAERIERERAEAISYAAHAVLSHRYERSVGAHDTLAQADATLVKYCGDDALLSPEPGSVAAFGLEVARSVLAATRDDGSFETSNYEDFSYASVNPPLTVSRPGTEMIDPTRWQPLSLSSYVTQNGIAQPAGLQSYIGPSWGKVTPFALEPQPDTGLPIDPGPPPTFATDPGGWFEGMLDVLKLSALLEEDTAVSDSLRVIAEFWADGPDSETPPGHWNTLANEVGDALVISGAGLRIQRGDEIPRLEFDVKLYLALNGANHDAAIAAWGTKAHYDYVRPISMIRYAAGLGQSTDPSLPRYHPEGLPLVEGLVELVTETSSGPGERHAHLANRIDEVVIFAWAGSPPFPEQMAAGVHWIPAVDWVPYQRPDFVSPAFAAYVSGHSAFSRASAEVLTAFTGSEVFPGGSFSHTVEPGGLIHELGPANTVTLSWITYWEASDEAGYSRRAGGIHVPADDLVGRELGAEVGQQAWARALELFRGS